MRRTRSTWLALSLPVLVALVYLSPWSKPDARVEPRGLSPSESAELWTQCNLHFQQGQFQQALTEVSKLHEAYPGNHIYLERTAEIYDRLGEYSQEAEFWEKYFDRAPNPVTACPQIGQAYWKQQETRQALAAFERCLALDPENSDSIFFLAHALERTGDLDRAAELYARGLKLAPQYTDLQIGLSRVWLRQGKTAEAKSSALQVIRRSPENVDALLVAGLVYSREGELAQAKHYLEKGSRLSDGYLDFHAALAEIAEQQRDFPEAIRQYDRILRDRPEDQSIRSKLNALTHKQ